MGAKGIVQYGARNIYAYMYCKCARHLSSYTYSFGARALELCCAVLCSARAARESGAQDGGGGRARVRLQVHRRPRARVARQAARPAARAPRYSYVYTVPYRTIFLVYTAVLSSLLRSTSLHSSSLDIFELHVFVGSHRRPLLSLIFM